MIPVGRLPRGEIRRAAALVIVLAFVVLLTGLTVAFFSSTLLSRQISNSSANETKVDLFAQGAVDTIVGDLKQEIAAGSNATLYTSGGNVVGQVYFPANAYTAVPALALKGAQSNVTTFAPNLVKRSAYQQNFFPTGTDAGAANYTTATTVTVALPQTGTTPAAAPVSAAPSNRAANLPSTTASQNGRSISLARWNKSLLLPKATANQTSDTILTPDSTQFVAPDWVLVDRSGNNPTVASNAVLGRYAYAIYDEGGLLDVNVAGYPKDGSGNSDLKTVPYKNALAFADLTQLPGINSLTAARQTVFTNSLVGWRNYGTAQPNSGTLAGGNFDFTGPPLTRFSTAMLSNVNGFLRTANTADPQTTGHQTDRIFASRQEMMRLVLNAIATQGNSGQLERANLQNGFQYLGTFSRGRDQPSYIPGTYVVSASGSTPTPQPSASPIASGGNDASLLGGDAKINPAFLAARVKAGYTRNDGSTANVGDPLVAKRFALSRLAWITFKGPICTDDNGTLSTDPDIQKVITQLQNQGVSLQLLQQGGPANIQKYFGLSWVTDTGISAISDGTKKWQYLHGNSGGGQAIQRLDQITGRDPDFFELLKAAVTVGSEAKGTGVLTTFPYTASPAATSTFQTNRDTSTDAFVVQLGANMMNQAAVDGFPRHLLFNDGSYANVAAQEYRGVADLPYVYRARGGYFKLHEASPAVDANATPNAGPIMDYGLGIFLEQPEIWNPHTWNPTVVSAVPATLRPVNFRFVMMSNQPPNYAALGNTVPLAYGRNADMNGSESPPSAREPAPISFTEANTELDFSIPTGRPDLFREPTLLNKPGIPTGSNLQTGTQHFLRTDTIVASYVSGGAAKSYYTSAAYTTASPTAASDNQLYLGVYFGAFPLWVPDSNASSTGKYVATSRATFTNQTNFLYRLEYQDPSDSSKWATYDEKFMPLCYTERSGAADQEFGLGTGGANATTTGADHMVAYGNEEAYCDPRTARFSTEPLTDSNTAHYYEPPPSIPYNGWKGWANVSQNAVLTVRSDEYPGDPSIVAPSAAQGMYNYNTAPGAHTIAYGWYTQNDPSLPSSTGMCNYSGANGQGTVSASQYYSDPDGIVRRAMGAYITPSATLPATSGTTPSGLPSRTGATTYTAGVGSPSTEGPSRPMVLNRPFRNVAELGYVFSGTPWKNVSLFTPESGYAALLDVFCINDAGNSNALVAGKVDLNTRQAPVLQAILTGAYRDEAIMPVTSSNAPTTTLTTTDGVAAAVSSALITRTSSTTAPSGPLRNLSDLVGRWTNSLVTLSGGGTDGKNSFDGFSKDLGNLTVISGNNAMKNSERYRESVIRALSGSGQTRVWNLMIDLVAQTGHYPVNAQSLSSFSVDGEQRYWVHLAIDRYTGQVIDKQIEIVKE